jgi:hypothetical protein
MVSFGRLWGTYTEFLVQFRVVALIGSKIDRFDYFTK